MGRCNGGGGRRHGGGGWQQGQKSGNKAGKAGHGKSGAHDASKKAVREPQRLDKLGRPLNHGPWRNGYRIEAKPASEQVERVGVGDAVAARLKETLAIAHAGGAAGAAEPEGMGGSSRSSAPSFSSRTGGAIVGMVAGGDPIHKLLASADESPSGQGKDKAWSEFSPAERGAAQILGYDERSWDAGEVSCKWADLSRAGRDAAALLGYTRKEWDSDADAVMAMVASECLASQGGAVQVQTRGAPSSEMSSTVKSCETSGEQEENTTSRTAAEQMAYPAKRNPPSEREIRRASEREDAESRMLSAHQLKLESAGGPFERMRSARKALPMSSFREEVLAHVRDHRTVIICGETGCGKSTQVPQFLLEEAVEAGRGGKCTILVLQPRRVAAVSLAARVAAERCEEGGVGGVIGYRIRQEARACSRTRICFVTTGVLLRRLIADPNLAGVSHVIVDEAHERSEDGDFALMVIKRILNVRPDLRLLLMSASLDGGAAELFSDYFGGAPIINVPGRTFPVTTLFLEQILELTGHTIDEREEWARKLNRGRGASGGKGGGRRNGGGKGGDSRGLQGSAAIERRGCYGDESDVTEANNALAVNGLEEGLIDDVDLAPPQLAARYAGYSKSTLVALAASEPTAINYELIVDLVALIASRHDALEQCARMASRQISLARHLLPQSWSRGGTRDTRVDSDDAKGARGESSDTTGASGGRSAPSLADGPERRLDTDGIAYTREEFKDFYGGEVEWDEAQSKEGRQRTMQKKRAAPPPGLAVSARASSPHEAANAAAAASEPALTQDPAQASGRQGKKGNAVGRPTSGDAPPNVEAVGSAHGEATGGAVLVFLPGMREIEVCAERLKASDLPLMLVPLHSSLTAEAQLACFVRPPSGLTKVVLATNIAETSITVDDVTAVIDTCRHKENRYDHRRRLEALVEDFAPRGCMTQRRGRAGRVAAGMAFHLITSHRYTLLPAQQTAELLRVPLERAALRAKRLFPDIPAAHTLSELPQPPSAQAIRSALATLISLGAIEPAVERGVGRAAAQEALTPLGCHLAVLPLDVRIGKLVLLGAMLGARDAATTLAATLTHRSPFSAAFGSPGVQAEIDMAKLQLAIGGSDHLTLLNAYDSWRACKSSKERAAFCQQFWLSFKRLEAIAATKEELNVALADIGMGSGAAGRGRPTSGRSRSDQPLPELLKALLVGAMWPRCAKVEAPSDSRARGRGAEADAPPVPPKIKIKDDTGVASATLHPSSVLYRLAQSLRPAHIIYSEATRAGADGAIRLRDATPISSFSLLLFGGRLYHDAKAGVIGIDDGWIRFRMAADVADLILAARRQLDALLKKKWEAPQDDTSAQSEKLIRAVHELLAMGR